MFQMGDFYVYIYLDPRKPGSFMYNNLEFNFEPFYVGKGTKNRAHSGIRDKKKSLKTKLQNFFTVLGKYLICCIINREINTELKELEIK